MGLASHMTDEFDVTVLVPAASEAEEQEILEGVNVIKHQKNHVKQVNETNLVNTRVKDSSAKLIFKDPILCAQFLRDYVDIPLLKTVQPEDIEDITRRYIHMFTEERDSDVVKKVRIKDSEMPFYLISLIEHKS